MRSKHPVLKLGWCSDSQKASYILYCCLLTLCPSNNEITPVATESLCHVQIPQDLILVISKCRALSRPYKEVHNQPLLALFGLM